MSCSNTDVPDFCCCGKLKCTCNKYMRIRRMLPWIPIIGIPLTLFYHLKYGDTGIEGYYSILTAVLQGLYCVALVYFITC